jgi:hypothetical protein
MLAVEMLNVAEPIISLPLWEGLREGEKFGGCGDIYCLNNIPPPPAPPARGVELYNAFHKGMDFCNAFPPVPLEKVGSFYLLTLADFIITRSSAI